MTTLTRPALVLGLTLLALLGLGGVAAGSVEPPEPAGAPPSTAARRPPDPARFVPPVDGAPTRRFEAPAHRYGPGHRGVDIPAAPGAPVRAAAAGTVVFAGLVAGRPVVSVDHPGGLRTTYEPVLATVRVGRQVSPGTPLGVLTVVGSHCAPAACLHWGARRGDTYVDPWSLLGPVPVRLLPRAAGRPAPPVLGVAPARASGSPDDVGRGTSDGGPEEAAGGPGGVRAGPAAGVAALVTVGGLAALAARRGALR